MPVADAEHAERHAERHRVRVGKSERLERRGAVDDGEAERAELLKHLGVEVGFEELEQYQRRDARDDEQVLGVRKLSVDRFDDESQVEGDRGAQGEPAAPGTAEPRERAIVNRRHDEPRCDGVGMAGGADGGGEQRPEQRAETCCPRDA